MCCKRILVWALPIVLLAAVGCAQAHWTLANTDTTCGQSHELTVKNVLLLDSRTGETWRLAVTTEGEYCWRLVPRPVPAR